MWKLGRWKVNYLLDAQRWHLIRYAPGRYYRDVMLRALVRHPLRSLRWILAGRTS